MANHLTPEIGEGKKFKWITNNAMQKFKADRINGKQTDKLKNHHKEE